MASLQATRSQPSVHNKPSHHALFDGFSWLEASPDLDLRLTLDETRIETKPSRPTTTTGPPPSSFRRRLSTTKVPFGRASISSSRPATRDSSTPRPPPVATHLPHATHARRKSRALSLITPKHNKPSVASIDPAAAHYQDPEARHKLRSYLASPQKFDEALQFGFPSNKPRPAELPNGVTRRSRSFSRDLFMASSEKLKTFLADDNSSVHSDGSSVSDGDSPRTPHTPERHLQGVKPFHLPSEATVLPTKVAGGEEAGAVASREMTLRMTLTRPDLRSCQDQPRAWRQGPLPRQASHSSHSRSCRTATPVSPAESKDTTQENMDKIFADIDRELSSSSEGIVKRFWNRVRRN
ncbi:hypothetical protein GGS20DRAFT_104433 [Poronia punctata]|nr:hypothetical protein GGS20DRAFT_104433 [Poronia punctata]